MRFTVELLIAFAVAFSAILAIGNLLGRKRRRDCFHLLCKRERTPATFNCGADLLRVVRISERVVAVDRDHARPYLLSHGEYFLRCPDTCEHKGACPRFHALADRFGQKTPLSLRFARVFKEHLFDDEWRISEVINPHSEFDVALVSAVVLNPDFKGYKPTANPPECASDVPGKVDHIVY